MPLLMLCAHCQTPNPDTSRFCSQCGEPFDTGHSHEEPSGMAPTTAGTFPASSSMAATTAGSFASAPGIRMGMLPAGFVLNDRYEIEQPLGMGGMGMVYRAKDRQLDVPVAIKMIRGEYAGNERILERFKKEITIARSVTHRNVARIYDLGEAEGLKYISMQYIEGKDLAHIVQESGPFSVERAVSVLRQVCSGLKEAHAVGVVHRDLKPQNIMLDGTGSVHVMDFGIAMSADAGGMTRTGALIGTPEYMAPEQAEGKKVDHRADIYSLGVTMYEILTGDTPFKGGTPWEVIKKQIEERAHSTRRTRTEVPEWLDTLVLKCLEKDPALRYQSVGEILADIDRQEAHLSARHYLPSRRALALVAAAVVLVSAGVGISLLMRPRVPVAGTGGRRSVAILPFENLTGRVDLDWLRTGLMDNLTTDLAESKYFRVLSRERLNQIFRELGLGDDGKMDASALRRIGEYGTVEAVVTGSFLSQGDQIRVNLSVKDPATGEIFSSRSINGRESEVFGMIDTLTRTTKELFELSPERLAGDADLEMASARTGSVEAVSLYQKGVDLLYQGKNLEAIAPLEAAVQADSDFAMGWARLAEAHMRTGHDRDAAESSQKAMDRMLAQAEKVTQADRAYIRALSGRISNRPEESIRAYEEMLRNDPDDAALLLSLGEVHERTGDFASAELRILDAIKREAKNPGLELALGRVQIKAGKFEDSLPALQIALELYTQLNSEEGQGNALNAIGFANASLGQYDEALAYYGRSEAIKRRIGDKRGLAATLDNKAGVLQVQGRAREATQITEEALALTREIGDQLLTATMLTNLGSLKEEMGDPREMARYYEEALGLWQTQRSRKEQIACLLSLSRAESALGRLVRAEERLVESERLSREIADEEGSAQTASEQAQLKLLRGDPKGAAEGQRRVLGLWQKMDREDGAAEARYRLAQALEAMGGWNEAKTALDASLKTYLELGDITNETRVRLAMARVLLGSGEPKQAIQALDELAERLQTLDNPLLLAQAGFARTRALAEASDPDAARSAAAQACAAADRTAAIAATIQCGIVRSLVSEPDEAVAQAMTAATRASDSGLQVLRAEADLALAEAYQRAGRVDQARQRARAAVEAGRRMGMEALARRAGRLAGPP